MSLPDLASLHAFRLIPGVGSKTLARLSAGFASLEAAWDAPREALRAVGIGDRLAETIIMTRPHLDPETEWRRLSALGIEAIRLGDGRYPSLLAEIPDAPFLIYKRGDLDWNSLTLMTVVGTRRPTHYGRRATEQLVAGLCRAGIGIVSGLALGVDGLAHRTALENSGRTVAVLGNSLDDASIAPRSHLGLAQEILRSGGALLSEYPPVTPAGPGTFPARNRLMAGMGAGVLVTEAAEASGSLITATHALEYNREVFAVPGSVFSDFSGGPHALIRGGAKLVARTEDILDELRLPAGQPAQTAAVILPEDLSPEEEKLCRLLSHEPLHVDRIVQLTTLETSIAIAALSMLEMKGLVRNIGDMHYIKTLK